MKKGQTHVILTVVFVIIAIALGIIAFNSFKNDSQSITGNTIREDNPLSTANNNEGIVCNPPYIRKGSDCCLDRNYNNVCDNEENENYELDRVVNYAMITPPFYLNAFSIKSSGVSLELMNNGREEYTIKSVVVSGCGSMITNKEILVGSKEQFTLSCSLSQSFSGDITIEYTKISSNIRLSSTGWIKGKVE